MIQPMKQRLSALVESGYAEEHHLNCAETILWVANQVYELGLDCNALRLAAGFGGGMGVEATCGALTGAVMVIGRLFTRDRGHDSPRVKELCSRFLQAYRAEMGSIDCAPPEGEVPHRAAQVPAGGPQGRPPAGRADRRGGHAGAVIARAPPLDDVHPISAAGSDDTRDLGVPAGPAAGGAQTIACDVVCHAVRRFA